MTSAATTTRLSELTQRYTALVDDLQALDQEALNADEVLAVLRLLETQTRRLLPVQHAAISQLETRSVAFDRGARNTATLLSLMLHVSPAEAGGRVTAARRLAPRRTVTGIPVEPQYPLVAEAQADGTINAQHARVITDLLTKLPDEVLDTPRNTDTGDTGDTDGESAVTGETRDGDVPATIGEWLEAHLTELAGQTDPRSVEHHARDLHAALDQDGLLREYERRERNRHLELHNRIDGSATLHAELTPEAAEHLRTQLDAVSKPAPETDGIKDPRTPGQRRHDGFVAIMTAAARAGQIPDAAGFTTTLVLTMDADTYAAAHHTHRTGQSADSEPGVTGHATGVARTGHGYRIPAEKALAWAGPEARIIAVLLSKTKGIEAYSTSHRLATEQQRLALLARDKGCISPGCDAPPQWTEAHHLEDWKDTGRTCVDDLALLCTGNHRDLPRAGYHIRMINARPWLIPPPWIDPEQKPIRNTIHD